MKIRSLLVSLAALLFNFAFIPSAALADNSPRFDTLYLREKVLQPVVYSGTVTLDFASASANACSADKVVTVSNVVAGDAVLVGPPNASVNAGSVFSGWVSAANTVTVRHCNNSGSANDPASGSFVLTIFHQPQAPAAVSTSTATPTATATRTPTNTPTNTPTP